MSVSGTNLWNAMRAEQEAIEGDPETITIKGMLNQVDIIIADMEKTISIIERAHGQYPAVTLDPGSDSVPHEDSILSHLKDHTYHLNRVVNRLYDVAIITGYA